MEPEIKISAKRIEETVERTFLNTPVNERDSKVMKKLIPTGNKAVDMVQGAIAYHWAHRISLRSISLMPRLYIIFWEYMNRVMDKKTGIPLLPGQTIVFYDIDIKKWK